ncbi:hypothetical protein T492DRAFT_866221 [Pavlovales sp. CCMP2436]|nr:hypothetical protein T492DRAFT_866221 [Pavlovales sp. CCMP2436]
MCWSLEVSIAFAVIEGLDLVSFSWRCFLKASATRLERLQRYLLPLLLSIFLIETIEALLNMQLLYVAQTLAAIITTVLFFIALLQDEVFEHGLVDIADSDFRGVIGVSSCSWIGEREHIHWVWKKANVSYAPIAVMLVGCTVLGIAYDGVEGASVWCWSAFVLQAYFIALPYAAGVSTFESSEHLERRLGKKDARHAPNFPRVRKAQHESAANRRAREGKAAAIRLTGGPPVAVVVAAAAVAVTVAVFVAAAAVAVTVTVVVAAVVVAAAVAVIPPAVITAVVVAATVAVVPAVVVTAAIVIAVAAAAAAAGAAAVIVAAAATAAAAAVRAAAAAAALHARVVADALLDLKAICLGVHAT